jgi:hypothetical protein
MRLVRLVTAAAMTLSWILAPPCVRADGMMAPKRIGQSVNLVASPKQEALLVWDGDKVQVTLRTHFRRGPKELAWVIPVPAKPEGIEKTADSLFTRLESETAPRFLYQKSSGFHIGCAAEKSQKVESGLKVVDAGTAGIFDYVVLTARQVAPLTEWLTRNDYRIPEGAEPVFQRYVDMDWHWLAICVRDDKRNEPTLAPHPIRYTYRSTNLVYPLVISRLSADEQNEVVLYVIARGGCECRNWQNLRIDQLALQLEKGAPSGTSYERLFREHTQHAKGHLLVTEFVEMMGPSRLQIRLPELTGDTPEPLLLTFSRQPTALCLTRMRALVSKEAMDRDVVLDVAPAAGLRNSHRVVLHTGSTDLLHAASPICLLFLGYLALLRFRHRRKCEIGQ